MRIRSPLTLLALASTGLLAGRSAWWRLREQPLDGRVALVTGGSRGLGLLIARELGRAGVRVAIGARDDDELGRARALLHEWGVDAVSVPFDVGDEAQVAWAVAEVTARLGPIDILINNAGIMQVGPIEEATTRDFVEAHRVMFWGVLHPTLAVLPQMRDRGGGRIVNVTSIGGRLAPPHLAPYASAKFAAVGLSEALRAELARDGVTVTTIVPGLMRTGSYLNAAFKGPRRAEFGLFSLLAALPVVSIDAERAARRIVTAIRRGEGDVTIGATALVASRFHGVFPGLTADLFGLVNRVLPRRPADTDRQDAHRGADVERELDSRAFEAMTALGRRAAARFNEIEPDRRER